jgi:hypothetical protein
MYGLQEVTAVTGLADPANHAVPARPIRPLVALDQSTDGIRDRIRFRSVSGPWDQAQQRTTTDHHGH